MMMMRGRHVRCGIDLGGEGAEGEEEAEHELLVLLGVQGVERAVPLAIQQAHPAPVEDVQHVRVVPGQPRRRSRRRRRRWGDLRHRRPSKELHRWSARALSAPSALSLLPEAAAADLGTS